MRVLQQIVLTGLLVAAATVAWAAETGVPSRNVNIIGSALPGHFGYDPLKQQNEPSCTVSPSNPSHICCGYNDYRAVDFSEIGDAWMGLSCSRDAGVTWRTSLLPGHPADPQYSLGLEFGADPSLIGVPGALLYNYIAADRDTNEGGLFLQRYVYLNKEDGSPVAPVEGPVEISSGNSGRFLDKPGMVAFLDAGGGANVTLTGQLDNGTTVDVAVPPGQVGVAAALFVGNNNNDGTKILYWRSQDWGETWAQPKKLTESVSINQGVSLSAMGNTVCAVWRRFADVNESNAIMYACSGNGGRRFAKAKVLAEMCPYDQGTTAITFRTNAFPTIVNDGTAFHVFWADRGYAEASNGPAGCLTNGFARVVHSSSANTVNWSAPVAVDDSRRPPDNTLLLGHQIFPTAFAANGVVQIGWVDTRDDRTQVFSSGFIEDFFDSNGALRRHTADVRTARLANGVISPSVLVSQYRVGILPTDTEPKQLEYNFLNPRIFVQGTKPFIGDYIAMTSVGYRRGSGGQWESNASAAPDSGEPTFFMGWTDTRDIRGDAWTDLAAPTGYTPATLFSEPDPTPDNPLECIPDVQVLDRTRDQNIYVSRIEPGTVLAAPGGIKPLGELQRAVPVFISNRSDRDRTYRLRILDQPADAPCPGRASWVQLPAPPFATCPPAPPVTDITVRVFSNSGGARTVFLSSANERPDIRVEALELDPEPGTAPQRSIINLNQDPLAPNLENPDFLNPDFPNFDVLSVELHNPDLENITVIRVDNPDIENPDFENPDWENPDIENPDYLNPDFENPDIENPDFENFELAFPDIENPDIENSALGSGDLDEGYTDFVWTMMNDGNTTTAYTAQAFVTGSEDVQAQLIVTQTYATAISRNCAARLFGENQVVVNIPDAPVRQLLVPDLTNPELESAATFILAPGFRGNVILRVIGPAIDENRVGVLVNSQSCNYEGAVVDCTPPDFLVGTPDFDAPEFDAPPIDINGVEATGPDGAVVTFTTPSATDAVDGPVPVACEPASGSAFALGTTVATCTAADASGNTATANFMVTVVDTTPPQIQAPGTIDVAASGPDGAQVDFLAAATATDLVEGNVAITCLAEGAPVTSPATFAIGTTTLQCSATDGSGNSASTSIVITVEDSVAPVLTVPQAPFVTEATGPTTSVDFAALVSASDAVDPAPQLQCVPSSGSSFPLGDTVVTCTATDFAGNAASADFTVTLADTTAPVLSVPDSITAQSDGAGNAIAVFDTLVSAQDAVDPDPQIACTPPSGSVVSQLPAVVECVATDASGNSASAEFDVLLFFGFAGFDNPYAPPPKGFKAGRSVPLNWRYTDASGATVDSASANPNIRIVGPFAVQGAACAPNDGTPPFPGIIVDEDSGSSDMRYKESTASWQFNWQTVNPATGAPLAPACYEVYVDTGLTGEANGPFPIRLR